MKNYYLILGVDTDATQKEIRAAYRELAKELHPDYYGEDSGPFMDLQEAYGVLNDPTRRRAYDRSVRHTRIQNVSRGTKPEPLRSAPPQAEPLIPESHPIDLDLLSLTRSFRSYSPSFDEIFDRLWENFDPVQPKVESLAGLTVEVLLTPWQAYRGGRVQVLVPAWLRCSVCRGRGSVGFFECRRCLGRGAIEGEYPVSIAFPPGISNNDVLRVPLDDFGIRNFYLTIHFRVSQRT